MTQHSHALFRQYPLNGHGDLSIGQVPTPYHIYDGSAAFIGGTADYEEVRRLLAVEQVTPVQTTSGSALMGIWVCDFCDASLGPHTELQFSIFVARDSIYDIPEHSLSVLTTMITRQDVQMLCHGLWNNTPKAVAYNRELLSLNARLAESKIARRAGKLQFEFRDAALATPIFSGELNKPERGSIRATFSLAAQIGFAQSLAMARAPWVEMKVVNPVGVALSRNAVAQAFTKVVAPRIRFWDDSTDTLHFGEVPHARLQFKPRFIEFMDGFRFVYLNPHKKHTSND